MGANAQVDITTDESGLTIEVRTAPAQVCLEDGKFFLRLENQPHVTRMLNPESRNRAGFETLPKSSSLSPVDKQKKKGAASGDNQGGRTKTLDRGSYWTVDGGPALGGQDEYSFVIALPNADAPQIRAEFPATQTIAGLPLDGAYPVDLLDLDSRPTFRYLGMQRGVHLGVISFQPYIVKEMDAPKSITRARIRINFNTPVSAQPLPNAPRLLMPVLNPAQIQPAADRHATKSSKADRILNSDFSWFSVDNPNVKLLTERDGVAGISLGRLGIPGLPLLGRDAAFLRLYYDGREQPLAYVDDGDGLTSAADMIYFFGRRSTGDTTYFDVHNTHASFYLTWSADGAPGLRYDAFPQIDQTAQDVLDVEINYHIEEDHFYNVADVIVGLPHTLNLHRTEHVEGEGWFWQNFGRGNSFAQLVPMTPSEREGSHVDFVFRYKTISDDQNYTPDHFLEFTVNNEVRGAELFNGYRNREWTARVGSDSVLAGVNLMKVNSLGAPEWRDSPGYVDLSAIDYLAVRGRATAFAWQGHADFAVPSSSQSERLVIPGFNNRSVFAIDTSNNLFAAMQAQKAGVSVRAGARAGEFPGRSIYFNDIQVLYDNESGEVAAVLENGVARRIDVALVQQTLAAAQDGDAFVLLFNGTEQPSFDFRESAQALGADISELSAGAAWMTAAVKGGHTIVRGGRDKTVASWAGFLVHAAGKSFELSIGLPAGRRHTIMATDGGRLLDPMVEAVGQRDLRLTDERADLVIITHSVFRAEAERLAQYRREQNGLAVAVFDVDNIYTQFSHGRKTPQALKDFLRFAYENWPAPAPEALILFGDASWDPRKVADFAVKTDFVPSYGLPVSDYWYTLLDGPDILPDMMVGRISAETADEARVIVDKIIDYEAQGPHPWQKNFLFLAGGNSESEIRGFRSDALEKANKHIRMVPPLCGTIDTVFKANASAVSTSQGRVIRDKINSGAVWVNYVGHAAPTIFDMDFGDASELNNGNRYPILATFSCQTAAFGDPAVVAKNEEFVREPGRGMVAAMGTTGFGNVASDNFLLEGMLDGIRFDKARRLGEVIIAGKMDMLIASEKQSQDPFNEVEAVIYNTIMQYSLLGDPYLELPIDTLPNLYMLPGDVEVVNRFGNRAISEKDGRAYVSALVRNAGVYISDSVIVRLRHRYEQETFEYIDTVDRQCFPRLFEWDLTVEGRPGQHRLTIDMDPWSDLDDADRTNNRFELTFSVFPEGVISLDPLPHWSVAPEEPVFRVMTPRDYTNFQYEFALSTSPDESDAFLRADPAEAAGEFYTEWRPGITLENDKSYWMFARTILKDGNKPGDWLIIPFVTRRTNNSELSQATLRSESDFAGLASSFESVVVADSVLLTARNLKVPLNVTASGSFATRRIRVQVGDSLYVDDEFVRGVHVFIFPRGSDVARYYQRFDIYDSDSLLIRELLTVLQSEVLPNETLLLANCDETWRRIRDFGYIEEYRNTLKLHGAQLADSLDESSSYLLIARNGSVIHEAWRDGSVDSTPLTYSGELERFAEKYTLATPVFGPAQDWQRFVVDAVGDPEAEWSVEIFGAADPNLPFSSLLLAEGRTVDLDFVDEADYPWLRFELTARRGNVGDDLNITNVAVDFVPEAELALVQSRTSLATHVLRRGEQNGIEVVVENLSPRATAKPYNVEVVVRPANSQSGATRTLTFNNGELAPTERWEGSRTFKTDDLAVLSEVLLTVAPSRLERELYSFNNVHQLDDLEVINDETDPVLKVYIDGEEFVEGVYVHNRPRIRVELYDDSPLPVLDEEKLDIELRRRGPFPESTSSMRNYTLDFVNDENGLKLVAEFDALLETGDNPLTIEGFDPTGNSTSATLNLVVSSRAEIGKPLVSPNPVGDELTVRFSLIDNFLPTIGMLEIFDNLGRRVGSLRFDPAVGANEVHWNLRGGRQELVAQGSYFLRVHVLGGSAILYSETVPIIFLP